MRSVVACLLLVLTGQDEPPDDAKILSLIEQLGADFLEEREPARKALEKAGKAAETRLVEGLSHADHRVRRGCLELLTPLRSPVALKRAGDLFALDDDPAVREAAFHLLRALGKDAEEPLIGALGSPSPEFRRGAVETLSAIRSPKCIEKIADLYDRETERSVKEAAWKCLIEAGKAAEPRLLKYLRNPDAVVRKDVLQSLRGSTEEATVAAVIQLFGAETDDAPLDQAYLFLLGTQDRAEPAFLAGLQNARAATRLKSIVGLKAIKSPKGLEPVSVIFLGECPPDVRSAAGDYLKSRGLDAEAALLRGLENKDPVVRLASIQVLGEIESVKALGPIGRLFREEKNRELHERCFEFLRRLGIRAEEDLLAALADEDKELRCQAILALGEARSERAVTRLMEFMTELDPRMREASEEALALIGPKAIEEVNKAVAAGRVRKTAAEAIEANYNRIQVERLLESQLGDDESTGYFEGQFKDLEAFGREKAVPVLIRILSERTYPFRHAERHERSDAFRAIMKELAVMALGELGGEGVLPALKAFANDDTQIGLSRRIREETLVALHRQGERKPLDDHLRDSRLEADRLLRSETPDLKEAGCDLLFSLGLLYDRLRRLDEAKQVYDELLAALDRYKLDSARQRNFPTTCYNLACIHSRKGENPKAVEWLEKAVRAGFKDRSWIRKDRDLDGIREEAGYKKLLADDALFEKKPPESTPGDR
jgi:HEAT repeat protein